MAKMHAITVAHPGGPELLQFTEVESPEAGPGELLVQTRAAGVNFLEIHQRSGEYAVDYPFTPGTEGAGVVLEVGAGVEGFEPGDVVTTSEGVRTYAERFVVPAECAVHVPEGIPHDVAAAIPLQGLSAHYLANSAANPREGETVVIHAGAGGVGLLLTQVLVARGVRVLTTASTEEKRELSLAAGATEALDYDDFADRARELTDGRGVAVVYDSVGARTFDASLASLRTRGELVLFGAASGPVPPFDLQRLFVGGSLSIIRPGLVHYLLSPEERAWRYGEIFDAIADGTLDFRIGARFPLAEAGYAHEQLESRATTGKVILEP
ncbi:quinone oxidoreductase family protein [Leucobacter sp. USHLN153]|uniref:quinone oxidoreductase family protein n=1 Tax=Leucobacter sp. USHLN153 TaxID=3081268 RepID=UPI003018DF11